MLIVTVDAAIPTMLMCTVRMIHPSAPLDPSLRP